MNRKALSNNNSKKMMELLAPAGTLHVFETAIKSGASAVYIGAPALNARVLSKDFSMQEIAAMISYAHENNVKMYLAMNSLMKNTEIPLAIDTLAMLNEMKPDGLIIQDLGIYQLLSKYFPGLRVHASTLLAAHNSMSVNQFEEMGFSRVVLARELTIKEISRIRFKSKVELEVFVHGAMCFSYSGLCLFSSYLGGKSGLRGACVQPCRRRYRWDSPKKNKSGRGKKSSGSGYFYSMNDLCGIGLIPELNKAGVSSLKIEGRLRSAQYVGSVVKAYRKMLDVNPDDDKALRKAENEAQEFLRMSMGRKTSTGYFSSPKPNEAVSPYHSGNIGLFLGRIDKTGKGRSMTFTLKEPVRKGDRLRLHQEKSGERVSFTLPQFHVKGKPVDHAEAGQKITIKVPCDVATGDSVYMVDVAARRIAEAGSGDIDPGKFGKLIKSIRKKGLKKKVLRELEIEPQYFIKTAEGDTPKKLDHKKKISPALELWFKIDDLNILKQRLPLMPDRLLVTLCRESHMQYSKSKRYLASISRKIIWALPPIINESDVDYYTKTIKQLIRGGFKFWQISHISQRQFFQGKGNVQLFGDYTLNVLNSLSLNTLQEYGLRRAQVSIESDKNIIRHICEQQHKAHFTGGIGMTVYGRTPLFTTRLDAKHFKYGPVFVSPKEERYQLYKRCNLTVALPEKPFSLLSKLRDIGTLGIQYVVVDISGMKMRKGDMEQLSRQITGKVRKRASTFNYLGTLK